jgi:hypothetical protein
VDKEICDAGDVNPCSNDYIELIPEGKMETEYHCSGGDIEVPSTCLTVTEKRVGAGG